MSLYTFICDFRGGTYLSQVNSADHIQAVIEWAARFKDERPIPEYAEVANAILAENSNPENAVEISGLTNIWCCSALCGDDLVLLDIIKTDPN